MKTLLTSLLFALALAGTARADCFVEYKAKQDDPLRLHYGIVALPGGCPLKMPAVERPVRERLEVDGWKLLTILGFGTNAPTAEQEANAGEYFLRY